MSEAVLKNKPLQHKGLSLEKKYREKMFGQQRQAQDPSKRQWGYLIIQAIK
jgi:hypothetical protein